MHWYLKIPRFDGRKTLAFNGLVFIAACGGLAWSVAGGSPLPVSDTALYLLGCVAALNGLLRLVTERPVWWRQLSWERGFDLGELEEVDAHGRSAVFVKAAEFVQTSDFTEHKERARAERILPYADFQRDLDRQLIDTREAFDGHVLPLDADERAN